MMRHNSPHLVTHLHHTHHDKHLSQYVGTLLVLTSLLYHAIIGIQGFDIADEGWSMTGFQQIFNAPESVEYLFMYYLTNLVGGLWNILFGWGGIYAFRLLTGIVVTLTAWVVFRLLRPYFNPWSIFVGIWASFLCSAYGMMAFYHNYLMELFTVCAAAALFRALTHDNLRWMALSGILIGCNVFIRLPNITLTALILLLIPYYINKRDSIQTWKMLGAAGGGFCIGVACVVLLMVVMGHWPIFLNAVNSVMSAGTESESNHQLSTMFSNYGETYKTIFTKGFFNNLYTIYLFSTWGWLWILLSRRYPIELTYLSTMAVLIMHLLPIGSDLGIGNSGDNCIQLAAPLLSAMIWKEASDPRHLRIWRLTGCTAAVIALMLFYARGIKDLIYGCYYDIGPRYAKTCLINHPLTTTFTTRENRDALEPLLHQLSQYVKRDDYLLCFQNAPTIHYLTHTRPYLYNPWPWCYDTENMAQHFLRAEREIKVLPVIVRDKMMIFNWAKYYPDWDNEQAEEGYFHRNKKVRLIRQFIKKHHYQVVWENNVFQILIPQQ